ncbi:DUF5590 domain-containing protein [Cytobacillus spongiae]|jgi:uncharacterized protein YpmB|uniref:cell wall elongation regulator TseB-like domain-containing protein n=1 Tax=Cytobacillus spongiae TaxID=2901381 RepID=UPI001F1FD60F|nr:DUF5590 domain-containing protein [Cytobacillus spongiae]UII54606.1 DUF5590 domain-containing protein [Cytobacillus spongiae]
MKKWIFIGSFILILVIGFFVNVYLNSLEPVKAAEKVAVKQAMEETSLKEASDFSLYHGLHTYYIVKGKDDKGEEIIVWLPEKEGKTIVKKVKDGVTKQQAVEKLLEEKTPKEIVSVRLGIEKNIPLWEIYYRSGDELINYYYVDFETGDWLKKIENL